MASFSGPDTLSLKSKNALITGSAKDNSIGAAVAKSLAKNGANVVIHHHGEGTRVSAQNLAASIAKEYGVQTAAVPGDISDQIMTRAIVMEALKQLGASQIDILVNGAADTSAEPLLEASPEHLQRSFGVNVFGVLYMTQAVVKEGHMPKGGRIINISTIASKMGMAVVGTHSAGKAAQDNLTASWAQELGISHGITVNSIAVGPTPTDASAPYLVAADGGSTPMADAMIAMTRAAKRLGTVEDIADVVLLLVQEKSRWITAQYISVSGGITSWL